MTTLPDPSEIAPSRDPDAYGARRGFGLLFWLAMGFALLCLIAAAAVAIRFGVIHPGGRAQPISRRSASALSPEWSPAIAPARPVAAAAESGASPADLTALLDRVRGLEAAEASRGQAASSALAAVLLDQAAAGPAPFSNELAAARRLAPTSLALADLAQFADSGAPSRAALGAELEASAAPVAVAARNPGRDAGFLAQLGYAFARIVSIRRIEAPASGADAALFRAERLARAERLEEAVAVTDTLPSAARAALTAWRGRALRRIVIDRGLAALRAEAASALTTSAAASVDRNPP